MTTLTFFFGYLIGGGTAALFGYLVHTRLYAATLNRWLTIIDDKDAQIAHLTLEREARRE